MWSLNKESVRNSFMKKGVRSHKYCACSRLSEGRSTLEHKGLICGPVMKTGRGWASGSVTNQDGGGYSHRSRLRRGFLTRPAQKRKIKAGELMRRHSEAEVSLLDQLKREKERRGD